MVATSARIGFVTREVRRAVSRSASAEAKYGSLARDTDDPITSYFSVVADAQERADERMDLLSKDRRLFTLVSTEPEQFLSMLDSDTVPNAHFVDEERGVDMDVVVTELTIDIAANTAQLKVWG